MSKWSNWVKNKIGICIKKNNNQKIKNLENTNSQAFEKQNTK